MAVDKKSDYVGNHGGAYTDLDGMSKQFTYIDHDKKTINIGNSDSPEQGWQIRYREELIERITDISGSLCPEQFVDFTLRGSGRESIEWNVNMLKDEGFPTERLRDLCSILENRKEAIRF